MVSLPEPVVPKIQVVKPPAQAPVQAQIRWSRWHQVGSWVLCGALVCTAGGIVALSHCPGGTAQSNTAPVPPASSVTPTSGRANGDETSQPLDASIQRRQLLAQNRLMLVSCMRRLVVVAQNPADEPESKIRLAAQRILVQAGSIVRDALLGGSTEEILGLFQAVRDEYPQFVLAFDRLARSASLFLVSAALRTDYLDPQQIDVRLGSLFLLLPGLPQLFTDGSRPDAEAMDVSLFLSGFSEYGAIREFHAHTMPFILAWADAEDCYSAASLSALFDVLRDALHEQQFEDSQPGPSPAFHH